jgi:hypothetical protein
LWLHNEDRIGWMKKPGEEKKLYALSKEDTERLLNIFAFSEQEQTEQSSPGVGTVSKKDLQITKFIIKSEDQVIDYKVTYKISNALYKVLAAQKTYYMRLSFPLKVQNIFGIKESAVVQGELVKSGYKEYEIHFKVPTHNLSSSQLQAIEMYYDGYNLLFLDDAQHPAGTFHDIIQMVKEHGAKMDLER